MPPDTARLTFCEMNTGDLDDMASLLGDPDVMAYYPRPKTRQEAVQWIDWNRRSARSCTAAGRRSSTRARCR